MRIGTWNLAGRWSEIHRLMLADRDCDVWLLTEVPWECDLPGGSLAWSDHMSPQKAFAAVWARGSAEPLESPHPATAAAHWNGIHLLSSVLPWRSCRAVWPDDGPDIASLTEATLERLRPVLMDRPVIWGGDWNNCLAGTNPVGTRAGAAAIGRLLEECELRAATAQLPHTWVDGLKSIDHIGVPSAWRVERLAHILHQGRSDHDLYTIDVGLASPVA